MTTQLHKVILFGAPLVVAGLNLFHPVHREATGVFHTIDQHSQWWIILHILNAIAFWMLGLCAYVLVREKKGFAASLSKGMLWLFVPFYIAFDSVVGIGSGVLTQHFHNSEPVEVAIKAVDAMFGGAVPNLLAAVGHLSWLIALMAAAVAFAAPERRRWVTLVQVVGFAGFGATLSPASINLPWMIVVVVTIGLTLLLARAPIPALLCAAGLIFGAGHVPPLSQISMLCLLTAVGLWMAGAQTAHSLKPGMAGD